MRNLVLFGCVFLIIFFNFGCCAITPSETICPKTGATNEPPKYLKYIVQKGDTFWKIAQMAYNDSRKWHKIYDANSGTIKDIAQLTPGDIILIPVQK